ncbi:MAG TPA: hypothetical protein VKC90_00020 [Chitinophagaceae bacterium]|nr:hypothetical protein [Chitinophagaceae bacterium]
MKKNCLWLFLFLMESTVVISQHKNTEWKVVCGDCIELKKKIPFWQRLHPYAGIHISGDAEMYYIGPSFQAGIDYRLRKKIVLSTYFHYYMKRVNKKEYGGNFEKGRFKTATGAILLQWNTGRDPANSFFVAGGVAIQNWKDRFSSNYDNWDDKRVTLIPAVRIGYFFTPVKNTISVELNGTGPYSYMDGNWHATEILTQLSFGIRFLIF